MSTKTRATRKLRSQDYSPRVPRLACPTVHCWTSQQCHTPDLFAVFPTALGWMAIIGSGRKLKRLTFGHPSFEAAIRGLGPESVRSAKQDTWNEPLIRRLKAYALGQSDDFRNVEVDLGPVTDFQRRVLHCCRRIPYGKTLTYSQLATQAGFPRAARAVGNCMAANPIPLVIPCHRVVAANGGLGGYSGAGGIRLKQRLLELETGRVQPRLARRELQSAAHGAKP